jgi:steroid delta-isomerase-like uncharacterized protein
MIGDVDRRMGSYIAAWCDHDVAALLDHFTDDAVYADAALGVAKKGRDEIGAFMRFFFDCYEDVAYVRRDAFGTGDRIAWEWTLSARYAKTSHTGIEARGQRISIDGCSIIGLRGELIARNTDYWNYATMAEQIGS